jgi:hypothetical protein
MSKYTMEQTKYMSYAKFEIAEKRRSPSMEQRFNIAILHSIPPDRRPTQKITQTHRNRAISFPILCQICHEDVPGSEGKA